MPIRLVDRPAENSTLGRFLDAVADGPAGLVLEGDPGIGKTTLWLSGLRQARDRDFAVLSARAGAAESGLAYAALADLLAEVDQAAMSDLPGPQRRALDQVLLRTEPDRREIDQRAVGSAFLAVLEQLAERCPVVVGLDDLQWLDSSSRLALLFALRRLPSRVGLLATARSDPAGDSSWLQLPSPDAVTRVALGPLSPGALHALLSDRLGHALSRPILVRIHEVSGGNPFYALELARTLNGGTASPGSAGLPPTLTELIRARVGGLDPEVDEVLLIAASVPTATLELIEQSLGLDRSEVLRRIEEAETRGIVAVDGQQLRFTHPLLAAGVYAEAGPARRRATHRQLAEVVTEPEPRARHLALGLGSGNERALDALDEAATLARARGAPAAAAELVELAVGLGGDTPQRRMELAGHDFAAGETERARVQLEEIVDRLDEGPALGRALSLLAVVRLHHDSFAEARDLLEKALPQSGPDHGLRVQIMIRLAYAAANSGDLARGVQVATDAVAEADRSGDPHPLGLAVGMRAVLTWMAGQGFDEPAARRAADLEDPAAPTPTAMRPSTQYALQLAWVGRVDEACERFRLIHTDCTSRGDEHDLSMIDYYRAVVEMWRGDLAAATLIGEDLLLRADQLSSEFARANALVVRAWVDAYLGREADVRRDAAAALEIYRRGGLHTMAMWPMMILGFLDASLGRYDAAIDTLAPLRELLRATPELPELLWTSSAGDAAEALIALDRLDEAEALVTALLHTGRRRDRAWLLAIGARCQAMLTAARGDVAGAIRVAEQALVEHDRLPMPFDRARTVLLLGQLQRRGRHRDTASTTLGEALRIFEQLDTPLWADRARTELSRVTRPAAPTTGLTGAERRVAELAATGMTNREVAATLFISPKTVEANLARVYRKLNIRSRAELGRRMSP